MYGENSGHLRDALATLLGQYHVNYRLHRSVSRDTSPLSVEERQAEAVAQIRRYRRSILSWCHQALVQGDPNRKADTRLSDFDPPEWLRRSLRRVLARNPDALPTIDELTTPQTVGILETWRKAAKATALAEHDLDRGLGDGRLDHREWLTLVGDIADVTRALLVLDERYQSLPNWERLRAIRHLSRYIDECASYTKSLYGNPDYNIDWRGWHPPDPLVSPDADTITQVLAAEHHLLNSLTSIPSMSNLRHLLASQRELSHLAADRARDLAPEQAAQFRHREKAYATLARASRTAGGLAGTGAAATRHSADAARLLVTIPAGHRIGVDAVRNLDKLFRHVDNALASAIEQGFATRVYLVRRDLPRIDPTDGNLAHRAREFFEPLQRDGRTPLIAVARRYLRSEAPRMTAPGSAAITRADFRAATNRRAGQGQRSI